MKNVVKHSRETLPVRMTDEERLAHGVEIARLHREADEVEEDGKSYASAKKDRAKHLRATASSKQHELLSGEIMKSIECQTIYDFSRGVKETVRLDSGEVIKTSVITDYERQATIGEEEDGITAEEIEEIAEAEEVDAEDEEEHGTFAVEI